MIASLLQLTPARGLRFLRRQASAVQSMILRRELERRYERTLKLPSEDDGPTLLADGLWDNPNHFFRLRLFLEAVDPAERRQLAALLRTPRDESRRTLEALGFTRFFALSDWPIAAADREKAAEMLRGARTHGDLLRIMMPNGIDAKLVYDTVLKTARHPQPPLDHPLWRECFADMLRLQRFYEHVFSTCDVTQAVLSHVWKNEYAAAAWRALEVGASVFHLTGHHETTRITKVRSKDEFVHPVDHLPAADYQALPEDVRARLDATAAAYLRLRGAAGNTDINESKAYGGDWDSDRLRARLGLPDGRFIALICFHAWFDFPHVYGMRNFTDFLHWTQVVLDTIRQERDVIWLLKPHPNESWYGGLRLSDMLSGGTPENLVLLDEADAVPSALGLADAVVTAHGTVAMEAAARRVPVLCADRSYYERWGFTTQAKSTEDFVRKLRAIRALEPLSEAQAASAASCLYLVFAPSPPESGALRLVADHYPRERQLGDLRRIVDAGVEVERQGALIRAWRDSGHRFYSVSQKVELCRRSEAA